VTRQASRQFADFAFGLVLAAIACQAGLAEQLVPLSELGTAKFRGETGGLYGNGLNEPPPIHRQLAMRAIAKIQSLDAAGKTSRDGKIVLLSIGMSNTTQEFSAFVRLANQERRKRPELTFVDGAQGGADAIAWTGGGARQGRGPKGDPWANVEAKLKAANVTDAQVQAIWIKQAIAGPAQHGEFPGHVGALENALQKIVVKAGERFPNLRIVFLSSRIYGGYATGRLNPEPYAYESAFAVRGLITRQIEGDAALNPDAERGVVRAPVLVWGPYLWAEGETPRKADGLVWQRTDFGEDGTHPSPQGRRKVAEQLLEFFTKNELGKEVFSR
jgi:hypothetical protein